MIICKGKFNIDVYKITVHICVCSDNHSTTKAVNRIIKKYNEESYNHPCYGIVFCPDEDTSQNYLFLSIQDLNINTITHETDHIRNYVIQHAAIEEKDDSREASANLNGYINEKVFQFLDRKNIKYTS